MSEFPRPLALLGWGVHSFSNSAAQACMDKAKDVFGKNAVKKLNLLEKLKNPATSERIFKGLDSEHEKTYVAIFSDERFAGTVAEGMQVLIDNINTIRMLGAPCASGFHRSDTYVNAMEELAGSLRFGDGTPVFNVKAFSCCKDKDHSDSKNTMKFAMQWAENPWAEPLPLESRMSSRFAAGVRLRPNAVGAFNKCWDDLDAWNTAQAAKEEDEKRFNAEIQREQVEEEEEDEPAFPPVLLKPTAKGGVFRPSKTLKPTPPPVPPPGIRVPPPPPPAPKSRTDEPWENWQDLPPQYWWQYAEDENETEEHKAKKFRSTVTCDPWEPWETTALITKVWKDVLKEFNVDVNARKELWCLSQFGERGELHANAIVAKLLKKKSDKIHVRNPSAFIHSCVRGSRHFLQSSSEHFPR